MVIFPDILIASKTFIALHLKNPSTMDGVKSEAFENYVIEVVVNFEFLSVQTN